ncbi:MAG: tRNA (N(6)-L-threonylcarbamoyladenosine(37)-C(2))-methylthiotransferase MtaB [Clostridia bacterium]
MKYKITTLGCKVNRYESEAIASTLNKNGFFACPKDESPDVFILNSCTVTATGDQKVRQTLRKEKRNSPNAIVVLTGCMAQAFPEKSQELDDADIIMGTKNRSKIVSHIMNFMSHKQRIVDISSHENGEKFEAMEIDSFSDRTRAYIKIQDGCNRFCSYCIIPFARGRVRSKPLVDLEHELNKLSGNGFKEIVLTGINLSCYGQDLGLELFDAVKLSCECKGIERVRLGSLEPELLTEDVIIKLSQLTKLCPQFHLSLQSGCDETLKRMNRHYDTNEYRTIVNNLRKYFKNPAITTDIMVGFPNESDEEFIKNLDFAKEIAFSQAHVFAYSRRTGTKADLMDGQIQNKIKEDRSKKIIQVTDKTREIYHKSFENKTAKVLFETEKEKNVYLGHTDSYVPVLCPSAIDLRGEIADVYIESSNTNFCFGRKI